MNNLDILRISYAKDKFKRRREVYLAFKNWQISEERYDRFIDLE